MAKILVWKVIKVNTCYGGDLLASLKQRGKKNKRSFKFYWEYNYLLRYAYALVYFKKFPETARKIAEVSSFSLYQLSKPESAAYCY